MLWGARTSSASAETQSTFPAPLACPDPRDLRGDADGLLLLLLSLRACGVTGSEVSVVEAFAAWSLARIFGSVPITWEALAWSSARPVLRSSGSGENVGVVAAVLVYRFLTIVPTLALGLVAATTLRR